MKQQTAAELTQTERDELRRRHVNDPAFVGSAIETCRVCSAEWPCPTVQAVDGLERLSVALAWYRAYAPFDECGRWLGLSRDEIMFLLDTATEQGIELIEYARQAVQP